MKTKDNFLIIEARHEEREDSQGFISRQFTRRYAIPEDVKLDQLVSSMSTDGILTIDAPKRSAQPGAEQVIPIRQTGRPAVVPTPSAPAASATPSGATTAPSANNGSTSPQPRESRSQNIPIERESAPAPPPS